MDNKFNKEEKAILSKLTRWCSGAEKCSADVRHWFVLKQISLSDISKFLDYLTENNFVNETRYVAAFVHDKFLFNSWGRLKISAELTKKGISQTIINQALENGIEEKEYINMLQNLLKKKKKLLDDKNISILKQKIRNFVLSKGFEFDLVYSETEKLIKK